MLNIYDKVKTHQVEVSVKGPFLNLFLSRLYKMHINISNIKYLSDQEISFITKKDNVTKLIKNFKDYKIKIKNEKGIFRLKPLILKNKIFLISLLLGLIAFLFFQNIIVEVNVIHADKTIRELVTDELETYGVKRLTLKKSYSKLQEIKQKILDKYPDQLEWLEIKTIGMTYEVRIEQRILTKIKESNSLCNIIATKSAMITKIISKKGMNVKDIGDYVGKGDIVIAGDIKANEEIKQSVCAQGEVYGEVWYTVNASIPLNYKDKTKTGRKRFNILYDNGKEKKSIFNSRFKNSESNLKKIFSLFGTTFYLQTEYEVQVKNLTRTKNEAIKVALAKAKEKIKLKLNDKERLITQKVLNNSLKNSKMEVEIFVSVEEQIGEVAKYVAPPKEESLE